MNNSTVFDKGIIYKKKRRRTNVVDVNMNLYKWYRTIKMYLQNMINLYIKMSCHYNYI